MAMELLLVAGWEILLEFGIWFGYHSCPLA